MFDRKHSAAVQRCINLIESLNSSYVNRRESDDELSNILQFYNQLPRVDKEKVSTCITSKYNNDPWWKEHSNTIFYYGVASAIIAPLALGGLKTAWGLYGEIAAGFLIGAMVPFGMGNIPRHLRGYRDFLNNRNDSTLSARFAVAFNKSPPMRIC